MRALTDPERLAARPPERLRLVAELCSCGGAPLPLVQRQACAALHSADGPRRTLLALRVAPGEPRVAWPAAAPPPHPDAAAAAPEVAPHVPGAVADAPVDADDYLGALNALYEQEVGAAARAPSDGLAAVQVGWGPGAADAPPGEDASTARSP